MGKSRTRKRKRKRSIPPPSEDTVAVSAANPVKRHVSKYLQAKWVPLALMLLTVGSVLVITMPGMLYPGDRNASRVQALNVVLNGEMGIPYADKATLGGFLEQRGQYFFENDEKQRIYSKYGIGYTLLQLPPLYVVKAIAGDFPLLKAPPSLLPVLNGYHVLLALGIAVYLYATAGMFTQRRWLQAGFVVATCFCTFTWCYLRAPAHEILQLLPFCAAMFHAMQYLRVTDAVEQVGRKRWMHLALATLFLCLLVAMKLFFAVMALTFAVCVVMAGPAGMGIRDRVRTNFTRELPRLLLFIALPAVAGIGLILIFNQIRFGSPMETGYSQWTPSGVSKSLFTLKRLPIGLKGYFWSSANRSVWHHNPLSLVALLGLYPFLRRPSPVKLFFLLTVGIGGLAVCCYGTWGEWCYGPRHMMVWAMAGALPAVCFVDWLLDTAWKPLRWPVGALLLLVLGWCLRLQCSFNGIHYFTVHYLGPAFRQFKNQEASAYLGQLRPKTHAGVIAHVKGKQRFPPVVSIEARLRPTDRPRFKAYTDSMLNSLGKPNYLLLKPSRAAPKPPTP